MSVSGTSTCAVLKMNKHFEVIDYLNFVQGSSITMFQVNATNYKSVLLVGSLYPTSGTFAIANDVYSKSLSYKYPYSIDGFIVVQYSNLNIYAGYGEEGYKGSVEFKAARSYVTIGTSYPLLGILYCPSNYTGTECTERVIKFLPIQDTPNGLESGAIFPYALER